MPRQAAPGPYPNRIAARRVELDVSQMTLAEDLYLPRPALSRLETGQALATPLQLDGLVRALRCDPIDLYDADLLAVIQNARARRTP